MLAADMATYTSFTLAAPAAADNLSNPSGDVKETEVGEGEKKREREVFVNHRGRIWPIMQSGRNRDTRKRLYLSQCR